MWGVCSSCSYRWRTIKGASHHRQESFELRRRRPLSLVRLLHRKCAKRVPLVM
jgi:hypothetical protein